MDTLRHLYVSVGVRARLGFPTYSNRAVIAPTPTHTLVVEDSLISFWPGNCLQSQQGVHVLGKLDIDTAPEATVWMSWDL
jgi:hypothetical protein